MYSKTILAFLLLTICAAADAGEPKERGFYLGAAGGQSIYDEDGAYGSFGDDEDNSLQATVGYKILKYFAVEARYADMGSFSLVFEDVDITAASIHAVGIVPFGSSGWELFGHLGFGKVNTDVSGLFDYDESATAGGIGVRFHPTPRFSIGIQTDVYVWEETSSYTMSVGATQLSVQAIF